MVIKNFVKRISSRYSLIRNFLLRIYRRPPPEFFDVGFHGDAHLIDFVLPILSFSSSFIETGTSVASTTRFVAEKFPNLRIYGCEPDRNAFNFAIEKLGDYKNVSVRRQTSPEFLYELIEDAPTLLKDDTVFWLDSHGNGFRWPLRDEIKFITSKFKKGYIFIDDFLVPENPQFGYDTYDGQTCSLQFIQDMFDRSKKYRIYYPMYKDKTSSFCDLRGWALIEFGFPDSKIKVPTEIVTCQTL